MTMNRETGKDRWKRVPKDYFKKPDRLQRTKLRLTFLALVLAVAWFAVGVDWKGNPWSSTDLNSLRANHGELAKVHAIWDQKCDACHVPFEPIDGRPLFSSKSVAADRSSDKLCMSCHAGPAHHSTMIDSEVKGCAQCHRDHQGREFSLVRLDNVECAQCHQSLEAHVKTADRPASKRLFGNVTRFDLDHPQFRPEAADFTRTPPVDKGRLKFNHALHLMPGIVKDPKDTPYTVERIPIASERPRYQKSGTAQDPVQLDCASCHSLDSSEVKASANPAVASTALPARSPGRFYLPATYETSCRACHTLTFDPRSPELEAPHGVQPGQVVEFLKRTYASQVVSEDPAFRKDFVPPVPLPGKTRDEISPRKRLDDAVNKSLKFVFSGIEAESTARKNANNCIECHFIQSGEDGIPKLVEPTKVPAIWFLHAAFDHTAHRAVHCNDCHAGADKSAVATDVLIPEIDNCVQCHAPAKKQGGWLSAAPSSTGGASFDCTECHRYHNGDQPLQGPGAQAPDSTSHRNILDFLKATDVRTSKGSTPKSEKP